jgi:PAS domain S-box-containing protein
LGRVTQPQDALDEEIVRLETELHTLNQRLKRRPLSTIFRLLFDSDLIPMSRTAIDGSIFDCNQAYADLTGYSREELTSGSITWKDLSVPESHASNELTIEQILRSGRAEPFVKDYIRKDGSRVSLMVACTATDTTGSDVLVLYLNLSQAENARIQLKKSEEQFRLLVESIPQIVFVGDSYANLEYINKRFSDDTGYDLIRGVGQAWMELVHPEDLPVLMAQQRYAVETGTIMEMEFRHRYDDGTYHWVLLRSVPMVVEGGKVIKWIGTATNIDEQKKFEQEIREGEERFRMLANGIPQIVWTATADGVIDFFNHRWLEYTGLSVDQSLDGAWQLLIYPPDLEQYLSKWNEAKLSGETYEHEFRLRRVLGLKKGADVPYLWHLCRAVALRNSTGRIIRWFGTWTEIHEQKNGDG